MLPGVVRISANKGDETPSSGTGFVLSENGEILTANHVVAGALDITVSVAGRNYIADIAGYDRLRDIAVLQLRDAEGLPVTVDREFLPPAVGEPVVAIGNALGEGLGSKFGTVIALDQTLSPDDPNFPALQGLIEFGALVQSGDSGGPLINRAGQVVGISAAADLDDDFKPTGLGFAIPLRDALDIADLIQAGTRTSTVHIGPPASFGAQLNPGKQPSPGVLIDSVRPDGPAAQAGLKAGDTVIEVAGNPVHGPLEFLSTLDRYYPGDSVPIRWTDTDGRVQSGQAVLQGRP